MQYSAALRSIFGTKDGAAPLFSFWSHFPDADLDADRLAEATVAFQREFDLDFVKTAPNGMYAIEDLGVQVDFSDVPRGGVATVTETPYDAPEAWLRLPEADLTRGALARELRALRLMRAAMPGVPIVFTVFSPMTIAAKLSRGRIHAQIAERVALDAVHVALDRIARSVSALSQAAIEAGADGVFFAHQDTGRDLLSYDDFCEFVAPYDIEALLGARQGRFNILHVHGAQIRFREI
ncbi:MAG: uroporphyrinogen decarboxylase family protein, partial [Gemmobacter sp.]